MTFGTRGNYDAVFVVGMSTNSSMLLAGAPTISPALTNYIGDAITLVQLRRGSSPGLSMADGRQHRLADQHSQCHQLQSDADSNHHQCLPV